MAPQGPPALRATRRHSASADSAGSSKAGMAAMLGPAAAAMAVAQAGHRCRRRAHVPLRASTVLTPPVQNKAVNVDDFTDVCEQTGITLARYMIELRKRNMVDSELNLIMNSIREATKVIACLIRKAPLQQVELLGLEGEVNMQGEDQKKLDVITNEVLKNALRYTGKLGTMASEEEDAPVQGGAQGFDDLNDEFNTKVVVDGSNYICVFDPLDGSSDVDAGVPVGTIFGIFKEDPGADCIIPDGQEDELGDS